MPKNVVDIIIFARSDTSIIMRARERNALAGPDWTACCGCPMEEKKN